jgi:GntR family transcriptional regulator
MNTVRRGQKPKTARPVAPRSDFFNPFPRYLQIRNILHRRLADRFAPGERFPTEHELCSEFGVSRETIREALLGLENEGLIARHRGKGSVVLRLPNSASDERLTGLVEDFTELALDTDVDVVRMGIEKVPVKIATALRIDRGAELFRILRLRRVEGKPFAFHDAFLPPDIGSKLARLDLTHTTLFRELRRAAVKVTEIYQHIDAIVAEVSMAKLLEVAVFETYFRADRYYYSVQVDQRHRKPMRNKEKQEAARR